MAYIIGKSLTGNAGYSLSYEELAQVYSAAVNGNPAARIALEKLPASEQRTAEMLFKAYSAPPVNGKKKGAKKRAKVITKAMKAKADSRRSHLEMYLYDSDPLIRETARTQLEKLNGKGKR